MLEIESLLNGVRECVICEKYLAHGASPVLQVNPNAKILIAGQAPGRKVHESGVPFDDASGDRLRDWMGVSKNTFYDSNQIAILPMGFCYPGKGKNGDLPPRPECEPAWRRQLLAQIPNIKIILVLGKYAQAYHFGNNSSSLTALVKSWQTYWPGKVPLPHPSPRNNIWLSKNRWFEEDLIPSLQKKCHQLLHDELG